MVICSFVRHTTGKWGWRTVLTSIVVLSAIFFASRGAAGQQALPANKAPTQLPKPLLLLRMQKRFFGRVNSKTQKTDFRKNSAESYQA